LQKYFEHQFCFREAMLALFLVLSILQAAPAERMNSATLGALVNDADTEVVGKPHNKPAKYEGYVKDMVEGIIAGSAIAEVDNHDKQDNKIGSGKVLLAVPGTCPSTLCGDQAVYVAKFGSSVISYWAKPGDLLDCTRNRHVKKGKCKNDSDKFVKLDALIQNGQGGYKVKNDRLVLMQGDTELYVYMLYINTWSTLGGTLEGYACFQRDPSSSEFFRIHVKLDKNMNIKFKSEPSKMSSAWPTQDEMKI